MWTNRRAAVRIWEFLFPPFFLGRHVGSATFRKVFLYLSLCGENMSETIELCGILTFWKSWIPFYYTLRSNFESSREPGKNAGVLPAANSLKWEKNSLVLPSLSLVYPAACAHTKLFTWHSQWWIFQYCCFAILACIAYWSFTRHYIKGQSIGS